MAGHMNGYLLGWLLHGELAVLCRHGSYWFALNILVKPIYIYICIYWMVSPYIVLSYMYISKILLIHWVRDWESYCCHLVQSLFRGWFYCWDELCGSFWLLSALLNLWYPDSCASPAFSCQNDMTLLSVIDTSLILLGSKKCQHKNEKNQI